MKSFLFTLCSIIVAGSTTWAQNGAGNGGDPLRNLFEQAQESSAELVSEILPCSFHPEVSPSIRDWILKNQTALAHDLRATSLKWIVDLQGTCAYTALSPAANIYLSYNECRASVRSLEDAMFTLIHESVHHFNKVDESFADEVARAVLYGTSQVTSCPVSGTPFDPNYCQGPALTKAEALARFEPASTSATLGTDYHWAVRSRTCQNITGCTNWSDIGVLTNYSNAFTPVAKIIMNLSIYYSTEVKLDLNVNGLNSKSPYYLDSPDTSLPSTLYIMPKESPTGEDRMQVRFGKRNVTNHCLWWNAATSLQRDNGVRQEFELVIYGQH